MDTKSVSHIFWQSENSRNLVVCLTSALPSLWRRAHWTLLLDPVRQDVSHGAAVLVKSDVEAIGVDLRTVGDFKHWFKANALLTCITKQCRVLCKTTQTLLIKIRLFWSAETSDLISKGGTLISLIHASITMMFLLIMLLVIFFTCSLFFYVLGKNNSIHNLIITDIKTGLQIGAAWY